MARRAHHKRGALHAHAPDASEDAIQSEWCGRDGEGRERWSEEGGKDVFAQVHLILINLCLPLYFTHTISSAITGAGSVTDDIKRAPAHQRGAKIEQKLCSFSNSIVHSFFFSFLSCRPCGTSWLCSPISSASPSRGVR